MTGRVIQGFFVGGVRPVLSGSKAMPRATSAAALGRMSPTAPRRPPPGPPPLARGIAAAVVQQKPKPGPPRLFDQGLAGRIGGNAESAGTPIQRYGRDGVIPVDPIQLGLASRGGRSLPAVVLAKMEAAFGADFSAVRIHVGPQAARLGALAFTTGNDVYFAPGQYQPDTIKGDQLIGHELAHVIQQRQGRVRGAPGDLSVVVDRALEAEADRLGLKAALVMQRKPAGPAVMTGTRFQSLARPSDNPWPGSGRAVQRAEEAPRRVSSRKKKVSQSGVDVIKSAVIPIWQGLTKAGTKDGNLVFAAQGGHNCAARGTANGNPYQGRFVSDEYHAEMDLLANIYAGEQTLAGITSIEIEKEPCPRCAVVLRSLGLSGVVTYKKSGQKDYPTWRFPDLGGTSWEEMLGIADADYDEAVVVELASYFRSHKFW